MFKKLVITSLILINLLLVLYVFKSPVVNDFRSSSIYPASTLIPTLTPTLDPSFIVNADKLFVEVNSWRQQNNYQPYKKSQFACNVATERLPEVKSNWSHDGFDANRFCKTCTISENLSSYGHSTSDIINGWLNSPPHKAALERDFTHSCIVCDNTVENYCVQIFSYF